MPIIKSKEDKAEYMKKYNKEYREKNRDMINEKRRAKRAEKIALELQKRREDDPNYKSYWYKAKNGKWEEYLG